MKTAVIGGGSWGTALASVLAMQGPVGLWARDEFVADGINETRRNPRYQSDLELPSSITATTHLGDALKDAELVCVVVPSHAMRRVMTEAAPFLSPGAPIVSASTAVSASAPAGLAEGVRQGQHPGAQVRPHHVRRRLAHPDEPRRAGAAGRA